MQSMHGLKRATGWQRRLLKRQSLNSGISASAVYATSQAWARAVHGAIRRWGGSTLAQQSSGENCGQRLLEIATADD
jgi:phage-related tail fiber protein